MDEYRRKAGRCGSRPTQKGKHFAVSPMAADGAVNGGVNRPPQLGQALQDTFDDPRDGVVAEDAATEKVLLCLVVWFDQGDHATIRLQQRCDMGITAACRVQPTSTVARSAASGSTTCMALVRSRATTRGSRRSLHAKVP